MGYPYALVLHTHLPMVVNHGRWPHGSDWLCEAAFECYLPLLEVIHRLVADGISPKWTVNISPILAEQLASPDFQKELAFYRENVHRACAESHEHFTHEGNHEIVKLTHFWEEFYERMWDLHPADRRQRARHLRGSAAPGPHRDPHLRSHSRVPASALPRRVDPSPAPHGGRDAQAPLRGGSARDLAARVRLPAPLRVDTAHRPRARPEPEDATGNRGDGGRSRPRVLRRRLAPHCGGCARVPLSRLRAEAARSQARDRHPGSARPPALALSRVPGRVARRHRPRRGVLPRSPNDAAGVEPRARLSRRLRLSRVPQEAPPGRPAVLADHR